jgi:hypothetical protein
MAKNKKRSRGKSQKDKTTEQCREMGPELLEQLKAIAFSPGRRFYPAKLRAIQEILNRGYGKPSAKVGLEPPTLLLK